MGKARSQIIKLIAAAALLVIAFGWMWKTYSNYRPLSPQRGEQMMRAERADRRQANAAQREQARAEQAQAPRTPQTPEQRRQGLYQRLNLSSTQRIQAEVIHSQLEMQGQTRERDFREALGRILTPEQQTALEQIQQRRRAQQRARQASPEA
jgi:hypothetical protein